jgi:hypothetical protein
MVKHDPTPSCHRPRTSALQQSHVPAAPEGITQGENQVEALTLAIDAVCAEFGFDEMQNKAAVAIDLTDGMVD